MLSTTHSWLLQGKESRLSVELVFKLHQAVDPASDVDIDEVECILANLIYKVKSKSQASRDGGGVGGEIRGLHAHKRAASYFTLLFIYRARSAGTSPTRSACWC